MDIVYSEEKIKDTIINIQTLKEDNFLMDNFRAHKKLKTSLQNFLKRVEQETSIVAVANSLAISSVENFTKYDPYYSNHSYQQELLQYEPLIINPQFAVHTMAQSELSNIYNTSCAWMRFNNWKHLTMKQLRHPQQFPFQISRNKKNSILHYVKTMDIQCFAQDKNKQMKQSIQRKKLEDIVGKLKEIESSNMNN
ncbi:uncharacterized protein LOC100577197 isoform X2 [Apis mellifera]|uniref:Uncharacterized protein LOC100577197 isoform X2 n=1 Tax=Apis mellifera TaxID=7460 RepID=A0A7M7MSD2_APIME|nr:uncharacterized protein LOC100577197 isoform X2 [Apis mellifera]|eukprot:XP_026300209.1 uncharacterized protein LOC100577197 isoform X2 [Apis mellifera]